MDKVRLLVRCTCLGLSVQLGATAKLAAQEPGTNVQTPPPAQAPAVMGTQTSFDAHAELPATGMAQEPVIDPATTRRTVPNVPILVTGAVLLGGSYGASAIVAAASDRSADDKLFYPVVGPWMDLDKRDCGLDSCKSKTRDQVLLIGDGVLQGLGALGVVLSLVIPERTTRQWYLIGNERLTLAPRFSPQITGFSAVGRF